MKRKNIGDIIRWILLIPVVCVVNVVVALLILSLMDYWIDIDIVCLCLVVAITVISFFLSKLIAPKYQKTTGIICALMGFLGSAIFCYILSLAMGMGY